MGCFGNLCAKGASVQPKKRYNLLVPAVFVSASPLWTSPLDAATVRNIGSLQEYVEENVQRAPKVSRRLWRRVCSDHAKPKELGNVKVRDRSLNTMGVHSTRHKLASTNDMSCAYLYDAC